MEEEVKNREIQRDLRSQVQNLEEREKKTIQENEELKKKLAKYEKSMRKD